MCFIILAVSPRMFSQGSQWFTLTFIRQAFAGYSGRAIFNSFWVATVVSLFAVAIATTIAWLVHRTNVFGRRFWTIAMWLLLMMPTWMMTLGWTDLLQPFGAASALGINTHYVYGEFFGPTGIVVVLIAAALPFAYFVVSAGLQGLGPEYEDAARIHGAGWRRTFQTILPIIAPAILSAFAISFAETLSDFGVAFTLGYHSHFPLATYTLFSAISNFPANFSVAAVIAAVLILMVIPPILLQSRVMRSRSYAVLSGRTRSPRRREFRPLARIAATAGVAFVFCCDARRADFRGRHRFVRAEPRHLLDDRHPLDARVLLPGLSPQHLGQGARGAAPALQPVGLFRRDGNRNPRRHSRETSDRESWQLESTDHRHLLAGLGRHTGRRARRGLHLLL